MVSNNNNSNNNNNNNNNIIIIIIIIIIVSLWSSPITVKSGLSFPLGLRDYRISNEQITASSYLHDYYPHNARLGLRSNWLAERGDHDPAPWIQFDLLSTLIVTGFHIEYMTNIHVYYGVNASSLETFREGDTVKVRRSKICLFLVSLARPHCILAAILFIFIRF